MNAEEQHDEKDNKYSLTISIIKNKLEMHLHDTNTKYMYHGSFDSNDLRKCGFGNKQASNMNAVSKFIESARSGAQSLQFSMSIEANNDNQNNSAEKLIFMLVFYKLYDEAFHALDFFVKNNIVSIDQKDYIENFINKNMSSNIVIITKCFFNFFFAIAVFMIASISKKYRQQGISYLKKNFRKLFYSIADTVKFSNKENNTSRDLKL